MTELRDAFVPLDVVLPGGMRSLSERLSSSPAARWSETVFDNLTETLPFRPAATRLSVGVVEAILSARGQVTVRSLARRLHVSERQLERIMQRDVGLPPIVLSRIVRIQCALQSLADRPRRSLSEVAVATGYFDQSHFVREFRRLVGCTPSQYLSGDYGLTEHFVAGDARA